MKYRWLLVLACVLMTACDSPSTDTAPEGNAGDNATVTEPKDSESKDSDSDKAPEKETEKPADSEETAAASNPAEDAIAEFQVAMTEWMAKARKAKRSEREAIMAANPTGKFVEKMRAFVKDHADSDVGQTAVAWLAANSDDAEERTESLKRMVEEFMDSSAMIHAIGAIAGGKPSQEVEDNLRKLLKDSPHRDVRGAAAHHLVGYYDRYATYGDQIEEIAKNPAAVKHFGEEGIEYFRNLKVDQAEIESLYESIVEKYGDVVVSQFGRETVIGEAAKTALYEIRNLSVGCVAPNIEGTDMDGEEFALSDYRGKVVMLDFWGDW